jgi:putative acetyltransferase
MAPSVLLHPSHIDRQGVFAARAFRAGEVVLAWDTSRRLPRSAGSTVALADIPYLHPFDASTLFVVQSPERFVNHSCDANTDVRGFADVAVRGIAAGEEISSNYETDGAEHSFRCSCGAPTCRGWIGPDPEGHRAGITGAFRLTVDDLAGPEICALLEEHLENMRSISPPESVHALDLETLQRPEITFWTGWFGDDLAGCGALKTLDPTHGEIKSMRTASRHRNRGVARAVLGHILSNARRRGLARVSLETGSQPAFEPARRLYASFGFTFCGPFGEYREDPNSVFMTLAL